jgi:uncharacterized protein
MTDDARSQDPREIARIVRTARTVAVVGLSPNELRPSHFVAFYLQRHGYRVIPVNPRASEVLGEPSYASLSDVPVPIDIVDVFRIKVEHARHLGRMHWLGFNTHRITARRP